MTHTIFGFPFSYMTLLTRVYNSCNIILLPHLLSFYTSKKALILLVLFAFLRIIQVIMGLLSWRRGMYEVWNFKQKQLIKMHDFLLGNVCIDEKWKDLVAEVGMLSSECTIVYEIFDTLTGLLLSVLVAWYYFSSLLLAITMPIISLGLCLPLIIWQGNRIQDLTTKHLSQKRRRHSTVGEVLSNLRTVKLLAMEDSIENRVFDFRSSEIDQQITKDRFVAANNLMWHVLPVLLTSILVLSWYFSGYNCKSHCFVVISLIQTFAYPLKSIPTILNLLSSQSLARKQLLHLQESCYQIASSTSNYNFQEEKDAWIPSKAEQFELKVDEPGETDQNIAHSTNRYNMNTNKLLNRKQKRKYIQNSTKESKLNKSDYIIEISNGSFSFNSHTILKNINLKIKEGNFVGICGSVGSGKSALLSAFLGELKVLSGSIYSKNKGGIAFVPQYPWLSNDTIRENIIFGSKEDNERFANVLELCELTQEIDNLPNKDLTLTGFPGINLSGGQQSRVSLARALYMDYNEVLILDDVFANVDTTLQEKLVENIIFGSHKQKTRILATHNIKLLREADMIIVMDNGEISSIGTFEELFEKSPLFVSLSVVEKAKKKASSTCSTPIFAPGYLFPAEKIPEKSDTVSELPTFSHIGSLYYYITQSNYIQFVQYLFCSVASAAFGNIADAYIFIKLSSSHISINTVYIYIGASVSRLLFLFFSGQLSSKYFNRTSQRIHNMAFSTILRAKMEALPLAKGIGELINPLTDDIQILDNDFKEKFQSSINTLIQVVINLALVLYFIPKSFPILVMVTILHFLLPHSTREQISTLENEKKERISQIVSQVNEAFSGATIIRTFHAQDRNKQKFYNLLQAWKTSEEEFLAIQQWSSLRIHLVAASLITAMTWIAVNSIFTSSSAATALVISSCFSLLQALRDAGLIFQLLLQSIISLGRLQSVSKLDIEEGIMKKENVEINESSKTESNSSSEPPILEFKKVYMQYSHSTPYVLQDISFTIGGKHGKRVGLIGRSGSGKTSVLNCLWRLFNPTSGSITINSVPIQKYPLHILRGEVLCIVPQHPIAFEGTIREFVDPYHRYTSAITRKALQTVGLQNYSPDASISVSGKNLSVGTKQLLSLCRILLFKWHTKRKLIVFLDEATAFIDRPTTKTLYKVLQNDFSDSTIVFIAHSLESIASFCDQVILMHKGQLLIKDTPDRAIHAYQNLDRLEFMNS